MASRPAAALDALKAKMTKHGSFSQEAIAARKEQRAVLRRLKATGTLGLAGRIRGHTLTARCIF
jgi:hypothetical protein